MKKALLLTLAVSALLITGACSDDDPPVADPNAINGSWGGVTSNGIIASAVSLTISSGSITSLTVGGVSQGAAVIAGVSGTGNVYEFALSSGTEGGFISDSTAAHMTMVLDSGQIGAVQKNATPNGVSTCPLTTNVVGSWSGTGFEADVDGNTTFLGTTTATVSGGGFPFSVSANSSNGETAVATLTGGSSFCIWVGTYSNSAGVSGTVDVALTGDQQFAGFAGCQGGTRALGFCGFGALSRQ